MGYRYSGPYLVQADKTILVEWAADRLVSVYILNEVDWRSWPKYGGPTSFRTMKTSEAGYVQFKVQYSDNFYIVVMGFAGSAARLYSWTEKLIWQERIAGSLRIIVNDADGNAISTAYVSVSGPESRSGTTDSNGQITFTDLAPGQYTLISSKSGFQTTSITVTVQQDKTVQADITMQQISSSTYPSPTPLPQSEGTNNKLSIVAIIAVALVVTIAIVIFGVKCIKQKTH